VIDRIHCNASNLGPSPQPPFPPGLAEGDIFMYDISNLSDGGLTVQKNPPNLTRGQLDQGIWIFFGHELGVCAGAADDLTPSSHPKLNVVDMGTQGNVPQRQGIARLNVRAVAGLDPIPYAQVLWRQNVALLSVGVMEQCNPRGSIGIIFDGGNLRRDTVFIPFEIDQAVVALVAAAAVPTGNPSVCISPTAFFNGAKQAFFGFFLG
jgi:hypothetical protein